MSAEKLSEMLILELIELKKLGVRITPKMMESARQDWTEEHQSCSISDIVDLIILLGK